MPELAALRRLPIRALMLVALVTLGAIALPASPAAAGDLSFSLSTPSGPAGSMVYLTADPCPAPPVPATQWSAVVTTSLPGDSPRYFQLTNPAQQPWFIVPTEWNGQADTPAGTYTINLACYAAPALLASPPYATYASQTFTVTGIPMHLQVSPATVTPGGSLSVTPTVPCPGGTTQVSVGLVSDFSTWARDPSVLVTTSADGSWTARLGVPSTTTATQFAVWAGCLAGSRMVAVYASPRLTGGPALPPPAKPYKYVALGDSFSAGEGVEPFWQANNKCHRSIYAYSMYIQQPGVKGKAIFDRIASEGLDWGFQACSGATTNNVLPTSMGGTGRYGDPVPQLELNRAADTSTTDQPVDADTDLVTITIGGNNVGFADIVSFCATSADCTKAQYHGKSLSSYISDQLNKLGPQLDRVYGQIHNQAPHARIIVAGYPQLFPQSAAEQNCGKLAQRGAGNLTIGFSQKEQNFLRGQTSRLNQVIADHVNRAAMAKFVPVDVLFQFHEVCGASGEWINAPQLSKPAHGKLINANSQSFHPNQYGQQFGYAAAINGELNGF